MLNDEDPSPLLLILNGEDGAVDVRLPLRGERPDGAWRPVFSTDATEMLPEGVPGSVVSVPGCCVALWRFGPPAQS
jgi:hypothetical protein